MDAFIISSLPSLCWRHCKWQGPFAPRTLLRFIATTDPAATLSPSADFPVSPVIRPTLLRRFLAGTRRVSPVAQYVLVTVLSLSPRRGGDAASVRFRHPMLPSPYGSRLGPRIFAFRGHITFTVVTARQLVVSPGETLSIGFRILISRHPAIQTTGRLTFAPAGLRPAEHTSLNWTHFRTAGFPQYGWKVGFPSGAFLDRRQLKPAPGIRCPPSSLPPLFVHLGVIAVIPHCVGPQTRLRTAMEGYYSSTPGVLARVRVIVSRSVITYATPSVPLMGTPRFHRKAAYTRCLRCAGAPRRPTSGSGLSLLIPS